MKEALTIIMNPDSTADELLEAVGNLTDADVREMDIEAKIVVLDRLYDIAYAVKHGENHGLTVETTDAR